MPFILFVMILTLAEQKTRRVFESSVLPSAAMRGSFNSMPYPERPQATPTPYSPRPETTAIPVQNITIYQNDPSMCSFALLGGLVLVCGFIWLVYVDGCCGKSDREEDVESQFVVDHISGVS